MSDYLALIKDGVICRKTSEIEKMVLTAVDAGVEPEDIINKALIEAMDVVGRDFATSRIFVPEMLVSAITMKTGLKIVKSLIDSRGAQVKNRGKMVIVTVKGDLHDIGKNIVAMMVEGAGFEVIDLGINIDRNQIVEAVKTHKPDILGLCALLTTTMPEMGKVIDALKDAGIRDQVKVLVGGAPLTDSFAGQIGADGYGSNAGAAVELCKGIMNGK